MATIEIETSVAAEPGMIWDAVRDIGALHTRLAPGVVLNTELVANADPPVRHVTFANGTILRETIVAIDDERKRLVWAIDGSPVEHHNGALQVFEVAGGARVVWTADVLPHGLAEAFQPLMEAGLAAMKRHLET